MGRGENKDSQGAAPRRQPRAQERVMWHQTSAQAAEKLRRGELDVSGSTGYWGAGLYLSPERSAEGTYGGTDLRFRVALANPLVVEDERGQELFDELEAAAEAIVGTDGQGTHDWLVAKSNEVRRRGLEAGYDGLVDYDGNLVVWDLDRVVLEDGEIPPAAPAKTRELSDSLSGSDDVYAEPVESLLDAQTGHWTDVYVVDGEEYTLESAPAPFDPYTQELTVGHNVFNEYGAWIGGDSEVPHRRFSRAIAIELSGDEIKGLFERYSAGDYGDGEAGFATYEHAGETIYLIDDAVRSLEGEPPLRDPETSPGPQTLMFSSDY